jgi:hypothetical protein
LALEQRLLDIARAATGDDSIFVVGDFLPIDLVVNRFADAGDGAPDAAAIVDDMDTWGSSREGEDRLPLVVAAVSPTTLYLLATEPGKGILNADRFDLVEAIDRGSLRVRTAERGGSREVIVEDTVAIREFTMVGGHAGSHFMTDVLDALSASPST